MRLAIVFFLMSLWCMLVSWVVQGEPLNWSPYGLRVAASLLLLFSVLAMCQAVLRRVER